MRQPLSVTTEQLEGIAQKKEQEQAQAQPAAPKKMVSSTASSKDYLNDMWKVPDFPESVDMLEAKARAFENAKLFMDDILGEDDMSISLEEREVDTPLGHVVDLKTGDVVNTYEGMDLLKVYAQNYKHRGLIVDGNV